MPQSEAEIHFELYRHLQDAIEDQSEYYGFEFGNVRPEENVNGGKADIVIEDRRGSPFLVIEAKRPSQGGPNRNLDPYSPKVIEQAWGYAGKLGAPYFATYNGSQLVLFRTHERGVHLLDRKARAYKVTDSRKFASNLLEQAAGIEKGEVKWEHKRDTFVKRLKEFHDRLTRELPEKLEEKLEEPSFKGKFDNWINRQGWDIEEDKQKSRFASQAAYLLMNKLFFYKVLEDTGYDVPDLPLEKLAEPEERREAFDKVVKDVDFEPIYEHDPIFDEIPLTDQASLEVGEFLEELDHYDLGEFKHDTIGYIYEDTIPPEVRHGLGQYYTPPQIVELITRLTIKDPDDKVLDPGCGSGTFLINSYNVLKELKEDAGQSTNHSELLDQIYGIDINRFPAQLTAINLALQDLGAKTEHVNVEVQDFFNVYSNQGRLSVERIDPFLAKGEGSWNENLNVPPEVDVVVANPPYIRQELISDKELCRKHLRRLDFEKMSERSDIYAYFFTHATEFLKEKGRIGFITSDKWLTVGYGKDLQEFFLENFKIKAIISFSKRVFETPLVPTCVTILEKSDNEDERNSNIVKFLRVKESMNLENLVEIVEDGFEPDILNDEKDYRLITKTQEDLLEVEKWNRYLYAPPIYWKLLNHEKICKLNDIAEVRRGITSGANDFFYMKEEEAKGWGINERFLSPVAKSISQTDTIDFTEKDTELLVIDIHKYVKEKLQNISEKRLKGIKLNKKTLPKNVNLDELSSEEGYVLRCLHDEGYEGLYKYIVHSMWEKDWGHYNPPHKRPTCQQYRSQNGCWFDLGNLRIPDLMIPEMIRKRMFVSTNPDSLVSNRNLYEVYPKEEVSTNLLAGIMNCSLFDLFRELHGRWNAGLNRFVVYEAKNCPILNPDSLTKKEKENIKKEINNLLSNQETKSKGLDRAVLTPLGLGNRAEEISFYTKALSKARRDGTDVGAVIEGMGKEEVKELAGAEIISEGSGQQKIDEF